MERTKTITIFLNGKKRVIQLNTNVKEAWKSFNRMARLQERISQV